VNPKKRIAVVLVIVALAAIGYGAWSHIVEEENANALTLYGNVDIREVELAFRVAGRLQSMRYD
jgi:HlyD family secretion protein